MPLRSLDVQAEESGEVSIYVFINAFYSREPAVACYSWSSWLRVYRKAVCADIGYMLEQLAPF